MVLLNTQLIGMLVVWLLMAGIAGAAPVALVPMVVAETFGLRRFGTLFGWLGVAVTLGLFVGPLMVGWVTDLTGGYTTGFEICAIIAIVGAIASFACTAPARIVAPAPSIATPA
jgi:MFS family permease